MPVHMQVVSYTGKGRAVNDNGQTLAETSNAAFPVPGVRQVRPLCGPVQPAAKALRVLGPQPDALHAGRCWPLPGGGPGLQPSSQGAEPGCLLQPLSLHLHEGAPCWAWPAPCCGTAVVLSGLAACATSGKACIYMDRGSLLPSLCSQACTTKLGAAGGLANPGQAGSDTVVHVCPLDAATFHVRDQAGCMCR